MGLLIGAVGETRICSNEGADVIFGAGRDAVFGCAVGSLPSSTLPRGLMGVLGFGGGPSGDSSLYA